jgi:chaperonin cofactor prefoldin
VGREAAGGEIVEDYKLKNTVNRLENSIDSLTKEIYNLKQHQADMLEQIKRLKEAVSNDDCK